MPVYEFECKNCGKTAEEMYVVSEKYIYPQCCGTDMSRLISKPNVIFKGDGFTKSLQNKGVV